MNTPINRSDRNDIARDHVCTTAAYKGKCFSWSAVIVGALVGLGISFLLNLFGIAIGLTAFTAGANPTDLTFAVGGFLGLLLATIVSMSTLGWIAGYLGALKKVSCNKDNIIHCNYGSLYGFTAWVLALILSIFLSAHVGKFLSYTVNAMANPAVAIEKYTYPNERNYQMSDRQIRPAMSDMNTPAVSKEDAKKILTTTTFAAFVLFLIGALFASFLGHISFERCVKKHGININR